MNNEKVVYRGKIFEIAQFSKRFGSKEVVFEVARRSPGVRLLIVKEDKILLTKEFRHELNRYDYRLPGGKVFDTLAQYHQALTQKEDISQAALQAAKRECTEETGLTPTKITLVDTLHAGATIEWDLFYFLVTGFKESKQKLDAGENIVVEWHTLAEVKRMCLVKQISEDRTVGVLLRHILGVNAQ